MKLQLLVIASAIGIIFSVNCTEYDDEITSYGDGLQATRRIFFENVFGGGGGQKKQSAPLLNRGYIPNKNNNYGKSYSISHPRPLVRPHTYLVPPISGNYPIVHQSHHPVASHPVVEMYNGPASTVFKMKGYPRYSLSTDRQYIPHYFPVYSPDVAIPPKLIQSNSGSYPTSPTKPYKIPATQYHKTHTQPWQDDENDEIEYYNGDTDTDSNDDGDDGSDENYELNSNAEAEERRDGPLTTDVHILVNPYAAAAEQADESYSKKSGASYENEKKSQKGYKTSTGHESEHKFGKGEKGHHDKEVHLKSYDEEGANKKAHHNEKDKHGSHDEEDHGEKKGLFDEKKKHRKGSKSKGYHNVFHKDEYLKDHTFYDDLDQSGHYKKFEEERQSHKKDKGSQKKGAHHNSGKKEAHEAQHGNYKKGHHDDADSGYDKKSGHQQHYEKANDYGKKGSSKGNHQHNYKKEER